MKAIQEGKLKTEERSTVMKESTQTVDEICDHVCVSKSSVEMLKYLSFIPREIKIDNALKFSFHFRMSLGSSLVMTFLSFLRYKTQNGIWNVTTKSSRTYNKKMKSSWTSYRG